MSRITLGLLLLWGVSVGAAVDSGNRNDARFVGNAECVVCHQEQAEAWQGSHHRHAMHEATPEFVRGNFNDVSYDRSGQVFRFYRKDGQYCVETVGPDGQVARFTVKYTFGWVPLQQYLLDMGDGKLQALDVAWDTEQNRWFAIDPETSPSAGDWLHWTGGAMTWNTMCADCHSTNIQQNYDAATDSFGTTWSTINVGCEACHGPGRAHVELMASGVDVDETRIRADLQLTTVASATETVAGCAPCHSLREKLTENYGHDGNWLDHFNPQLPLPPAYFSDGQIRQEVYVYGSFLQSRMYSEGVDCNDCHDPHSLGLKAGLDNNGLCLQCHEQDYATRKHHFHPLDSSGSQCIECHMPGRLYMGVDFRRDHSFRAPRPDLSRTHDVPNACANCHEDRTAEWAANKVVEWYGERRTGHFSDV
ncbi:MAG: hypothetical protein HUJ31_13845, partial [Pseudomonadales bacterium]|nr:hypothetical protein [Pseudomonadales bacterium]